jgi:hypothetical protein
VGQNIIKLILKPLTAFGKGETMKSYKINPYLGLALSLPFLILFQNCSGKSDSQEAAAPPPAAATTPDPGNCMTLDCKAKKYSLIVADRDGANITVVKTSSYKEMTHPRVSADKRWITYTGYNQIGSAGCADLFTGYLKTEIRAVGLSGVGDKQIIAPVAGEFNSNNYWIGNLNEFTFLSGPPSALKIYRAAVDSSMNLVGSPTLIPVPSTIHAIDPQAHLASNKIVYPALYNPGSGFIKGLVLMNLSDSGGITGLTIGSNHSGYPTYCTTGECPEIEENDPKFSPNGSKVAFMRRANQPGNPDRFGFHIFVTSVGATPGSEVDISYPVLGSDLEKNEGLPEWIDDDNLIFSTIEIANGSIKSRDVYTMNANGSQRTKIALPSGYFYSDVFPFTDSNGKARMVLAVEKIGATCSQ